ncbi:hypothetical protein E1B28_005896 [Marasmius oreades]|uniref:E2 ubiquitin-conjugating enzyme n=1 Tax=Marasmius oreades TaxID=181124 RepID=A0A9P7S428_9AGAR|nr:uncharacterized protein E1B28_005896 [Marasmius oreades]KAG7095111.1 hypothetical protein E1B28_005896 [Marasmius oreades]
MPPPLTNSMTLKRIHREVADLKREDLGAMTLSPSEDSLFLWKGTIPGPEGSVYEGGVFNVDVTLPADYPFSAPKVSFKTRIYHMNISDRGDICIDILKHNWSPALSLFKVMLSLSSLLTDPNPKDPLVSGIANQYITNRKAHDDTARQWTTLYAKPKALTKPSSKAMGKAKISASSTRSNPVLSETIEIIGSDDESPSIGRHKASRTVGTKRKRETRPSEGAELEFSDDEEALPSGSSKTASRASGGRVAASGSGRRVAPRLSNEVIVIEDD